MNVNSHYARLFRKLTNEHGPLDERTLTSIVGFGAGGPVSLSKVLSKEIYVTCELSLYPEQIPSSEGIRFELLCLVDLGEPLVRKLLTALGGLSMEAELGHGHTINVAGVLPSGVIETVELSQYSRSGFVKSRYGVYEVRPC